MPGVITRRLVCAHLLFMAMLVAVRPAPAQQAPPLNEADYWQDVPVVVSVTRMSQSVVNAPQAVTVIDRQMIEASGAREIPELFRLVPGFVVGYHDGHTPGVSYHYTKDRFSRQMQVLIDGRSVYTTAIGGVPWATLPITLDDIERIEVVRGPNSASFGANSFLGVINIITRHPVLDHETSVKTNLGDEGVREVFVRHGGGAGKLDYRVSAGFVEDDGFPDRLDYKRTRLASFRADYAVNARDMLTFEAGVAEGPRGVENRTTDLPGLSPDREKEEFNHFQQIRWQRSLGIGESVAVQFYHIFQSVDEIFITEPVTLATIGGNDWVVEPMQVDFSRRTHRYELELEHDVDLTRDLRLAWGGGVRDDQVWGGHNLMPDGDIHNHLRYGFANLEWSASRAWLFNAGAMVEDYSTIGTHVSPRAGVNYRFSPGNSLRLTRSDAIRAPSMFEYASLYHYDATSNFYNNGTLVAPGSDIYEEFWVGTRNAKVEEITSYELGYHALSNEGRLEFDIKVFHDDLRRLIGLSTVPTNDFNNEHQIFNNRYSFIIRGLELEAKITFFDKSRLYLGYAYIDIEERILAFNSDTVTRTQDAEEAPHETVSLLYMMDIDHRYSAGIGYYYTGRVQGWESAKEENYREAVQRLDVRVARYFDWEGHDLELALAARNVLGDYPEMELLRHQTANPQETMAEASAYVTLKVSM